MQHPFSPPRCPATAFLPAFRPMMPAIAQNPDFLSPSECAPLLQCETALAEFFQNSKISSNCPTVLLFRIAYLLCKKKKVAAYFLFYILAYSLLSSLSGIRFSLQRNITYIPTLPNAKTAISNHSSLGKGFIVYPNRISRL
jgi:hypothetical protein